MCGGAHIIDLYHAREHLVDLCKLLFDHDLKCLKRYKDLWWDLLDQGQIEALIGQRLKQSGMEWTVRGANAIAALRCVTQSNRFEDYWDQRAS